eukprot:8065563-Pyramimonas_sp.AAC.1
MASSSRAPRSSKPRAPSLEEAEVKGGAGGKRGGRRGGKEGESRRRRRLRRRRLERTWGRRGRVARRLSRFAFLVHSLGP